MDGRAAERRCYVLWASVRPLLVVLLHVYEALVAHSLWLCQLVVRQGDVGLTAGVAEGAAAVAAVVLPGDEVERHTALVARLLVLERRRHTHRSSSSPSTHL